MSSVFLSYDRDDLDRAGSIALALEKAGHSVWWDQHLKGGAQYSKAIEEALKGCDAVVVLWSERSVESAWVRDEAAAGRDAGRLVPVRIDGIEPPLGFRQYHTIDLSRWKGHDRARGLKDLLSAIEAAAGGPSPEPSHGSVANQRVPRFSRAAWAYALVILATAFLAGLLFVWKPWDREAHPPVVSVAPVDTSQSAKSLSNDLFIKLGNLQAADADALRIVEPASEIKPDLLFRVGGFDGEPRANLALIDNRASTLLWSREFVQPGGNQADLRQQLAYSAARVLRCATEALSSEHSRIELPTLKLYLSGCADLSNLLAKDPRVVIATFKEVTEQAPAFAGGWAKLMFAEITALSQTDVTDHALRRDLRAPLRAHIRQARKLNPTMAESYLSEAWLQTPRPIIGWMRFIDEAVARNPNHADALRAHALALGYVGRMREAIDDAQRAAQVEPLSPSARDALILALMDSGAIEAARNELGEAERLWPGATNLINSRFFLEYRYGDPKEAMRILQSGRLGFSPDAGVESFLKARIDPSPANVERAIGDTRSALNVHVQVLAAFGRNSDLVKALLSADASSPRGVVTNLFRPAFATLRRDPRFIAIAHRLGVLEYWRQTGKWPDFCSRADLPYDCKREAAKFPA